MNKINKKQRKIDNSSATSRKQRACKGSKRKKFKFPKLMIQNNCSYSIAERKMDLIGNLMPVT